MPNWCSNVLTISGDEAQLAKIKTYFRESVTYNPQPYNEMVYKLFLLGVMGRLKLTVEIPELTTFLLADKLSGVLGRSLNA
jgi:hypothetical protein